MSTGLSMMLKSLGVDPKMLEGVSQAVIGAAEELKCIRVALNRIESRLTVLEEKIERMQSNDAGRKSEIGRIEKEGSGRSGTNGSGASGVDCSQSASG